MSSTRTPASGTISMRDLDKSIVRGWTTETSPQDMSSYNSQDFNTGTAPNGFAYCYGNPGVGTPNRLSDYYNILGYVDYQLRANNLTTVNTVMVDFNPMNGSNGAAPGTQMLSVGSGNLPTGVIKEEGAHWETIQFVLTVGGMAGGSFDVYFDGTYIDTILTDGIYVYDNGGLGYTNGAGAGGGGNVIVEVNLT
jgi:hypothetical protein